MAELKARGIEAPLGWVVQLPDERSTSGVYDPNGWSTGMMVRQLEEHGVQVPVTIEFHSLRLAYSGPGWGIYAPQPVVMRVLLSDGGAKLVPLASAPNLN